MLPAIAIIQPDFCTRRLGQGFLCLQAEEATKLEHAEEVMRQNALDLAQRTEAVMVAPQVFLNMGLVAPNPVVPMPAAQAAPELRLNRGDDNRDNAVRCSIM